MNSLERLVTYLVISAGGGGGKDGLGVGSIKDGKQVQDVGVSGSFLSDIKPQVSTLRAFECASMRKYFIFVFIYLVIFV